MNKKAYLLLRNQGGNTDLTTKPIIFPAVLLGRILTFHVFDFYFLSGFHARLNRLPGAAARCLRKGRRRLVGKVLLFAT